MIPYNLLTTIISLPEKPVEWPKSYTIIGLIFIACGIGLIFLGLLTSDEAWMFFGSTILLVCLSIWIMAVFIPNMPDSIPNQTGYSHHEITYEERKQDYQEALNKYQGTAIAKTYKKDNQYFMVLDNKDNTIIEITEEAYDVITPNKPVKQYLTILEKE